MKNYTAFFAGRSKDLKGSEIGELLKEVRKGGFISFAAGVPDPALFPVKGLRCAADAVISEDGARIFQYGEPRGDRNLRAHLTRIMKDRYGIEATEENVLLTSGSMQCIDLCTRLFIDEGDVVLVESPTFTDAMNTLGFTGGRIVGMECDGDGPIPELLEAQLQATERVKAIYVITDFRNPTGTSWSVERRTEILRIASKYDVLIFEDNPYGDVSFTGEHATALYALDTESRVIFMGSLSKTLSPGIRIGWLTASATLIDSLVLVKERTDVHSSIPDQATVGRFMDICSYDAHVKFIGDVYGDRAEAMAEAIRMYLPEWSFRMPGGGFFLWVSLPEGQDSMAFFQYAMEERVAVVPGNAFYPDKRVSSELRLNFTGVSREQIEEGVMKLAKAYEDFCSERA